MPVLGQGGMILSKACYILVLNMDIPNSPVSFGLTSNAFRKIDCHFYRIDVIQDCFEELVILFLAALHV